MNSKNFELAKKLVNSAYVSQGADSHKNRENKLTQLLSNRCLPKEGWDELTIKLFIRDAALMDSNNFVDNVGVGEREARVYSRLVKDRHYDLAHGIGRSGEINAIQPKAAGSSLILKVATFLALHVIKLSGVPEVKSVLLLPLATGMSHVMTLLALKAKNPKAHKVIWPRIDQKTCLKSIVSVGLTPVIVENKLEEDQVRTDVYEIERLLKENPEEILCVLSTSSCFAPRCPDRIVEIAKLCKTYNVAHVINNAYGIQCSVSTAAITSARRKGRVDAFIQSMDKNFMVPVGGAIIAGFDEGFINSISKLYPGRASMSPILDLCITLLSMGQEGWLGLLRQRQENFTYLRQQLEVVASESKERILHTPDNPISIAMSLESFEQEDARFGPTSIGSMLFSRCVSGPRTVERGVRKNVAGIDFVGYGAHISNYPFPYLTAACSVGMTRDDVDVFIKRLRKTIKDHKKKVLKAAKSKAKQQASPSQPENSSDARAESKETETVQ